MSMSETEKVVKDDLRGLRTRGMLMQDANSRFESAEERSR